MQKKICYIVAQLVVVVSWLTSQLYAGFYYRVVANANSRRGCKPTQVEWGKPSVTALLSLIAWRVSYIRTARACSWCAHQFKFSANNKNNNDKLSWRISTTIAFDSRQLCNLIAEKSWEFTEFCVGVKQQQLTASKQVSKLDI